jgi:hypothetical protein
MPSTIVCASSWRERFPRLQDHRHHPARLALGQPQHLVGRSVGWGAALHRPTYDITHIVDRVGGGDAFMPAG